jgi:hypothetical protein
LRGDSHKFENVTGVAISVYIIALDNLQTLCTISLDGNEPESRKYQLATGKPGGLYYNTELMSVENLVYQRHILNINPIRTLDSGDTYFSFDYALYVYVWNL